MNSFNPKNRTDDKVVFSKKPYAKIIVPEKRKQPNDRRKSNTYVAADRRKGFADRRNQKGFLSPNWQVIVSDSH